MQATKLLSYYDDGFFIGDRGRGDFGLVFGLVVVGLFNRSGGIDLYTLKESLTYLLLILFYKIIF